MGQLICTQYKTSKHSYETVCHFQPSDTVLSISYFKSPVNIVVALIEVALLVAFWICTGMTGNDFAKYYFGCAMIPVTGDVLFQIISIIAVHINQYAGATRIMFIIQGYFSMATNYVYIIGLCIFLIQVMRVAHTRRQLSKSAQIAPYVIALAIGMIYAGFAELPVDNFIIAQIGGVAVAVIGLGTGICCCVMCCVCCCCSKSKPGQDYSDPVVYNAKTRMGWTIVFMCFAPAANAYRNDYVSNYTGGPQSYFISLYMLGMILQPILLLVPIFVFLPTYRSALFCCCENRKIKKIDPSTTRIQPQQQVPPPTMYPSAPALPSAPPAAFMYPLPHGVEPVDPANGAMAQIPQQQNVQYYQAQQMQQQQYQMQLQMQQQYQMQQQQQYSPQQLNPEALEVPQQQYNPNAQMPQAYQGYQQTTLSLPRHSSQPNLTVINSPPVVLQHSSSANNVMA